MFNIRKTRYTPHTKLELRKLILDDDIELKDIDTSHITDMSHLFEPVLETSEQARFFFDGIETWDVSNVTGMSLMFCDCEQLKSVGDLSNWNVSNVERTWSMFHSCKQLKSVGDLSNWNVSKIKNMMNMFKESGITNIPDWYRG